jgi:hypothetical protein
VIGFSGDGGPDDRNDAKAGNLRERIFRNYFVNLK